MIQKRIGDLLEIEEAGKSFYGVALTKAVMFGGNMPEFVDTVWPKCPRHRHPLWFRDGSWWCERDDLCVARLGELESYPLFDYEKSLSEGASRSLCVELAKVRGALVSASCRDRGIGVLGFIRRCEPLEPGHWCIASSADDDGTMVLAVATTLSPFVLRRWSR